MLESLRYSVNRPWMPQTSCIITRETRVMSSSTTQGQNSSLSFSLHDGCLYFFPTPITVCHLSPDFVCLDHRVSQEVVEKSQ